MKQGSQILPQQQLAQEPQIERTSSWPIKIMIAYLYFAQGCIWSIAHTIPYAYKNLPDYFTLSLFSMCTLPFSFKFVTAPLLQKYTSLDYGKRKTWIVINQSAVGIILLLASFYSGEDQQRIFALLLFPIYIGLSMQDISLDALCLKQLKDPKLMSMIQNAFQSIGTITGGLILLKFTSEQFALKIGFNHPISTLHTVLISFSVLVLLPTIIIHFFYKETHLDTDQRATKESILKVYGIYKNFLKLQYRYCRTLIFFVLYNQGINFVMSGINYQYIKAGFTRDDLNTIDNAQNIVVNILVFMFGMKALHFGFKISFVVQMSLIVSLYLAVQIFFPKTIYAVIAVCFLYGVFNQWGALLRSNLSAHFPEMGASGMIYTMNTSMINLGRNTTLHTALLKTVPWRTASLIGLAIQIPIIVFFIPNMIDLIQEGETSIQFQMSETQGDGVRNQSQLD